MHSIYLYNDQGTCPRGVNYIQENFTAIDHSLHFKTINADRIINGHWRQDAKALIIPGGADLPYCQKLQGAGNQQIIEYVTNGGNYIGICAGAYYASWGIEFDSSGPLKVVGTRPLKFYPGTAIGPILAPYNYQSPLGARIAKLRIPGETPTKKIYHCYYNGGGYFVDAHHYPNVKVLYEYYDNDADNPYFKNTQSLAAIVECRVAKGKAILSGVHFEWNTEDVAESLPILLHNAKLHQQVKALSTQLKNQSNLFVLKDILARIK